MDEELIPEAVLLPSTQSLPPPLVAPPPAGGKGESATNVLDPEPVVIPTPAAPSVITLIKTAPIFNMPKALADHYNQNVTMELPVGNGMQSENSPGNQEGVGSPFGSFSGGISDFEGEIYDLGLDNHHKLKPMNQATCQALLTQFVAKNWDAHLLDSYYKASKKLYAPAIWIPTAPSKDHGRQMHLEKELNSGYWIGWYRAKVLAPHPGHYHFVGIGDDFLAVALDKKMMLDGGLWQVTPQHQEIPWRYTGWGTTDKFTGHNNFMYRVGTSFTIASSEPLDLDILIGDWAGFYSAFLLIVDEDKTYPTESHGVPLYPIFKLHPDPVLFSGEQPPHAENADGLWYTVQNPGEMSMQVGSHSSK